MKDRGITSDMKLWDHDGDPDIILIRSKQASLSSQGRTEHFVVPPVSKSRRTAFSMCNPLAFDSNKYCFKNHAFNLAFIIMIMIVHD